MVYTRQDTVVSIEGSGNKTDWSLWCYITAHQIFNNNYKCKHTAKIKRVETKCLTWQFKKSKFFEMSPWG